MSATTLFGTLTGYREGRCNNEEFSSATLWKRPCNNKDFLLAKNITQISVMQMEIRLTFQMSYTLTVIYR